MKNNLNIAQVHFQNLRVTGKILLCGLVSLMINSIREISATGLGTIDISSVSYGTFTIEYTFIIFYG